MVCFIIYDLQVRSCKYLIGRYTCLSEGAELCELFVLTYLPSVESANPDREQ